MHFHVLRPGRKELTSRRGGIQGFEHVLQDIQTLGLAARERGELDITAISIHAYAAFHMSATNMRFFAEWREHGRRLWADAGGRRKSFRGRKLPERKSRCRER